MIAVAALAVFTLGPAYLPAHGAGARAALPEAIFSAYFSAGRDIGDVEVLVDIAVGVGYEREEVRGVLQSDAFEREVAAKEVGLQADGVHSVPSIRIGRHRISGAQPPGVMAEALAMATAPALPA